METLWPLRTRTLNARVDNVTPRDFPRRVKKILALALVAASSIATAAAQYAQTDYLPDRLQVGDMAPDFRLKTQDGTREVQLSAFRGKQPVVLFFGSYTCMPFREEIGLLEETYAQFKDRAQLFLVYINEAHPIDGLQAPGNEVAGIRVRAPHSYEERRKVAHTACSLLKTTLPCLVDDIDNTVNKAYSAWPDRFYLIDTQGKVAFISRPRPKTRRAVPKIRKWLERNAAPAGY
jgi:peroxiredoxin